MIAIDADVRAEGGYEVFSMALTEKVIFYADAGAKRHPDDERRFAGPC